MSSPTVFSSERASRLKLLGTVLAIVELQNGTRVRAHLNQISINGGLLQLENPLDEATAIKLMFHLGNSTIRSRAEMLPPIWASRGWLQPFRFTAVDEQARTDLEAYISGLLDRSGKDG